MARSHVLQILVELTQYARTLKTERDIYVLAKKDTRDNHFEDAQVNIKNHKNTATDAFFISKTVNFTHEKRKIALINMFVYYYVSQKKDNNCFIRQIMF